MIHLVDFQSFFRKKKTFVIVFASLHIKGSTFSPFRVDPYSKGDKQFKESRFP